MDLRLMDFEKASIPCSMYHSPTIDLSVEPAFARPCKNFFPCHSLTRSLHAPFMVYSWCLVTELCRNSFAFVKISPFLLGLRPRASVRPWGPSFRLIRQVNISGYQSFFLRSAPTVKLPFTRKTAGGAGVIPSAIR